MRIARTKFHATLSRLDRYVADLVSKKDPFQPAFRMILLKFWRGGSSASLGCRTRGLTALCRWTAIAERPFLWGGGAGGVAGPEHCCRAPHKGMGMPHLRVATLVPSVGRPARHPPPPVPRKRNPQTLSATPWARKGPGRGRSRSTNNRQTTAATRGSKGVGPTCFCVRLNRPAGGHDAQRGRGGGRVRHRLGCALHPWHSRIPPGGGGGGGGGGGASLVRDAHRGSGAWHERARLAPSRAVPPRAVPYCTTPHTTPRSVACPTCVRGARHKPDSESQSQ